MRTLHSLVLSILAITALPASALDLRVGSGPGCTHASLQGALDAIEGLGGDHAIRINAGTYAVPDGMVYQPTVAQGFVRLEGGYANCTDSLPSGSPTTDAGRSLFDGSGGLGRSVLEVQSNGLVGSFQLRRIALQGGDASSTTNRFNAGGGLAVYGRASVLVGSGVAIRNNVAGYGGGVALAGGRIEVNEAVDRIDFFIDEGAEIRDNVAADFGGGIYCGGATTVSGAPPMEHRHASIVHRDGSIRGNRASAGFALFCLGSYAGGGYQPRPNPGAVARVADNSGNDPVSNFCPVLASLDLIVAPSGGVRILGAIEPSNNGFLLLQNNRGGAYAGLCIEGWATRGGASPAPSSAPVFWLQNALFLGNRVRMADTLSVQSAAFATSKFAGQLPDLTLKPSSPSQRCGLLPPLGPCVVFEDNGLDGLVLKLGSAALVTGRVRIEGARISGNDAAGVLVSTQNAGDAITIQSSLIEGNLVSGPGDAAVLFASAVDPGQPAAPTTDVFLAHNTVTGNVHDRFFRIEGAGRASVQGTVLHGSGDVRLLRTGSAPDANLSLRWCNYLTTLADPGFSGATQVGDGFGALVTVTGPLAFGSGFTPPLSLIDRCRTPQVFVPPLLFVTQTDYYGEAFGHPLAPLDPNRPADIGAVEFRPMGIFADGFEQP
jgi:predicted outer membrane repeat protein